MRMTLVLLMAPALGVQAQDSLTLRLNREVSIGLVALRDSLTGWIGRTPVTMRQFGVFVDETGYRTDAENPAGNGPGRVGGHGWSGARHRFEGWFPQYTWRYTGWTLTADHPASNISWNDASRFTEWLSAKTGRKVRLPTEREWDRAARAGTSTRYFTGDTPASLAGYANVADSSLLRIIGWDYASGGFPFDDGYPFTSPVARFRPNPWGLYDVLGNVFQWCSGVAAPRVCGCSYNDDPRMCAEARGDAKAYSRYAYFGFRVFVESGPG